jgi:hypothetical protein
VWELAKARGWVSDEHFSVDGTLIEAWASMKSFKKKDEPPKPPENGGRGNNDWVDLKGEKRSNETHESTSDPEAKLIKRTPGLDGRTARSAAYRTSQRLRKRIEENFGWMKAFGNFRKSRWIGAEKTHFVAQFVGSACNLVRMAKLSLAGANLPLQPAAA